SDFVGFDCADGPWTYTATALCTPIGDEGACCTAGVCTDGISSATCTGGGGTFQGLGTTCFDVTCPGPEDSCAGAIAITALPYNAAGTTVRCTSSYDSVSAHSPGGIPRQAVACSTTPLPPMGDHHGGPVRIGL
ncbi:MAG: hypothetical protein IPK83_16575, partial [Planctomycetes bacterium]|nr:hypothetical protein [Planctomycetota bacterium]